MDSLGEVGKKMRSAIKAKLVELGNASPTGYIDDELPDYVMIMVANKRSKQQMLTDLNLFLGSNTETFVNWLHQVLQKLQEVTLPTNLATKAKKKISETSTKKDKKKDKKKAKEPSITDVIAVELMEKAKKTIDPKVKCEKKEKSSLSPDRQATSSEKSNDSSSVQKSRNDDLNIPTISELQKQQNSSNNTLHRKELAQLEEVTTKINVTKRKLITMTNSDRKEKSKSVEDTRSPEIINTQQQHKSSVKSRLGSKPIESSNSSKPNANIISLSAIRKSETEFLKKIVVKQKEDNDGYRSSSRSSRSRRDRRSLSRDRYRNTSNSNNSHYHRDAREKIRDRKRTRSRSPIKPQHHDTTKTRPSIRQRIGDRITIRKSRTPERVSDGNFKVKQRPALSSTITAHAGKSLLLRAMADAQRSTSDSKKKQQRDNIVVQVKNDEEYIPESISGHSESEAEYHPSYKSHQDQVEDDGDVIYLNNNDDVDLDDLDDNVDMKDAGSPKAYGYKQQSKEKSHSPTPPKVIKRKTPLKDRIGKRNADKSAESKPRKRHHEEQEQQDEEMDTEECESQRAYNKVKKSRVSPIRFNLTDDERDDKSRSSSRDRSDKKNSSFSKNDSDHNGEEHTKRIKLEASRSFDHVPALLSSIAVPVPDTAKTVVKSKERCKFYPNCTNQSNCTFFHPTTFCKAFPNCKFGDNCNYLHPKCKFDVTCNRVDCNFSHTPIVASSNPVIASSIVPAQNYKSITITPNMTVCKFFPGCTNTNCIYQHPKICKFGKNCVNKYECNFYHFETASKNKFKWVSSTN